MIFLAQCYDFIHHQILFTSFPKHIQVMDNNNNNSLLWLCKCFHNCWGKINFPILVKCCFWFLDYEKKFINDFVIILLKTLLSTLNSILYIHFFLLAYLGEPIVIKLINEYKRIINRVNTQCAARGPGVPIFEVISGSLEYNY